LTHLRGVYGGHTEGEGGLKGSRRGFTHPQHPIPPVIEYLTIPNLFCIGIYNTNSNMTEDKINILVNIFLEDKDIDIKREHIDLQAGTDSFYEVSLGDDYLAIMGENKDGVKMFLFHESLLESSMVYSVLKKQDRITFIKILYRRVIEMLGGRLPEGYDDLDFSLEDFLIHDAIKFYKR
jgi:hypothetical protein